MDPEAVVHNISSDEEEVDCGENENRGTCGGDNDYDWISELLEAVDKETPNDDGDDNNDDGDDDDDDDDDDDVVVVDEKDINPKQGLKSSVEDLDDECMILDGDPDKAVEIQDNPVDESDELLVVSEKGQVACRDYPHARHLCAKYPFNSSPHQNHCEQCHCYVCDSRVPCIHWGAGTAVLDHCHATDKDDYWVLLRKSTKNGVINQSPKSLLVPLNDISLSIAQPPQINNLIPSPIQIEPNYVNQVCMPMPVHSINPNFTSPNIINPNQNPRSGGFVVPRNKFQPGLSLHQRRHNVYNNPIRRCNTLGPQSIPHRQTFKRSGSFGTYTTNQHVYSSSNNMYGSHFLQNLTLPGQNPLTWQDLISSDIEPNSYWANSSSGFSNHVPCQPNSGFEFENSVPCQPHESSLPNVGPTFGNQDVSPQPYITNCFENSVPSQLQDVSPQPYITNCFENSVPSQLQVYTHPIPVSNDNLNISYQESQSQGGPVYSSLTQSELGWVDPSNPIKLMPSAENVSLKGAAQIDESLLPMEYQYDEQQFPNPNIDLLSSQYDSWILSNQPVLSPEPGPLDGDFFFDY